MVGRVRQRPSCRRFAEPQDFRGAEPAPNGTEPLGEPRVNRDEDLAKAGKTQAAPRYGRGIAILMASIGLYAAMITTIKHVSLDYSVFQILFFRNLFALPMILPTVLAGGGLATLATRRAPLHLLRGSVSVSGHLGLYWAIGFLALADVTAIQFTGPLMVTALSALVLHEAVGPRRWLAVIVGFAGVLIMVPPTGEISLAALVVLAATLCYALMVILTRVLTATETVGAIAFYQAAVGLTVGLSGLAWAWTTPSWGDFLLLALVGIWAGLAQLTLVSAVKHAPPPVLAPFDYLIMVWAIGFDFVFWQALPSTQTLVGAAVIAGAGLYIAQRESGFVQIVWRWLAVRWNRRG